jgi:hypothetical protein
MPTTGVPRPIKGTIGSRVRVILGDTCDEWLLILNKDNGDTTWQTHHWSSKIPNEVATQLNNCTSKGRIVKQVDFGPTGAWYINGQKPDGSGAHSWWGNTNGADIKEWSDKCDPLQVSFGTDIFGSESRVLIIGSNGYSHSANLQLDRLKQIHGRSKKVNFVRLFSKGNYFMSDQENFEWIYTMGDDKFENEMKRPPRDIRDIALAGDGSWVVVRDNKYTTDSCVDLGLAKLLHQFFSDQRRWNNTRSREIREARERAAQDAREQQAREERGRIAGETAEREERERILRETEEERERIFQETEEQERQKRQMIAREKAEREIRAKEAIEAAASARVSTLEAVLEKRLLEEAADIKTVEANLQKRKRSLQESLKEIPPARRARISLKNESCSTQDLCVVCHDQKPVMAVVPCGHLCLCEGCSSSCMEISGSRLCPLCRGNMQTTMKIYTGN